MGLKNRDAEVSAAVAAHAALADPHTGYMLESALAAMSRAAALKGAPTAFTSLTAIMMGFAHAFTPTYSGTMLLMIAGSGANNTLLDGFAARMRYGTGAAPAYGVAAAGTFTGPTVSQTSATANANGAFCLTSVVTGLIVNTAYWLDLEAQALIGGTVQLSAPILVAVEL